MTGEEREWERVGGKAKGKKRGENGRKRTHNGITERRIDNFE